MDSCTIDSLIENHMNTVENFARRYGRDCDVDDLMGYAYEQLIVFAKNWKPDMQIPFVAYLSLHLKPRLAQYKRRYKTVITAPQRYNEETFITVQSINNCVIDVAGFESEVCDRESLKKAFGKLTPREMNVVHCLYYKNMNGKDVAKELGVSRQTVCKLKRRALDKLRNEIVA